MTAPPFQVHSNLSSQGIVHGFFGRRGGVSKGLFDSLNCGFGSSDTRECVAENRRRVSEALNAAALLTVHQTHSPEVVRVQAAWTPGDAPRADAIVGDTPGLALAILTADCAPVLFADPEAGVIGAAHAGWKGAFGGVLEATVAAMIQLGADPNRVQAIIGPAISADSYEVGPEFHERFVVADAANKRFFQSAERHGHFQFDLPAYVEARLNQAGLTRVGRIFACTYVQGTDYFSYRRATHRCDSDYGRNVSAILIQP